MRSVTIETMAGEIKTIRCRWTDDLDTAIDWVIATHHVANILGWT